MRQNIIWTMAVMAQVGLFYAAAAALLLGMLGLR
jgi:hypothetical protein